MAVSSNSRWVIVAELKIRLHKEKGNFQGAADTPVSIDMLLNILQKISGKAQSVREYGAQKEKRFWISDFSIGDNKIAKFLIHFGDKDVADPYILDFNTSEARKIEVGDEEGMPFSSHVQLRLSQEKNENYLLLIERNAGVHLTAVENYLRWVLREANCTLNVAGKDGKRKDVSVLVDLFGYQSRKIKDVLKSGTLQDVEFVSNKNVFLNGFDEEGEKLTYTQTAKVYIGASYDEEDSKKIFNKLRVFGEKLGYNSSNDDKMLIRLKTNLGQIKQTEHSLDADVLNDYFVAREQVDGFKIKLPQFYEKPLPEMTDKFEKIFERYSVE